MMAERWRLFCGWRVVAACFMVAAHVGGVLQAFAMIGSSVGPVFAGWARDTLDSYEMPFLTFAAAVGVAIVASLLATLPTKKEGAAR